MKLLLLKKNVWFFLTRVKALLLKTQTLFLVQKD